MLCIIQARMSSKRLKGKVLMKLNDEPILGLIIRRLKNTNISKKKIIVATSSHYSDLPIINYCKKKKINFYKGNLNNVASRFFNILKKKKTKFFLRISGDSPFIDPKVIQYIINFTKKRKFDVYTNVFPRTFPKGQSIEIINKNIYMNYYSKIKLKSQKEHITKFFYDNSKLFKIKNFFNKKNYSKKNMSVDTRSDFKKASKAIKNISYKKFESLSWNKILERY